MTHTFLRCYGKSRRSLAQFPCSSFLTSLGSRRQSTSKKRNKMRYFQLAFLLAATAALVRA